MYARKHQVEEIPEEMTDIWTCSNEDCNCWMRDNFAFDTEPLCTLCHAPMVKETKMLPQLVNMSHNYK